MFHVLIAGVAILALLILGTACAWLITSHKSRQLRSYEDQTIVKAIRNRSWDAAVARARNRPQRLT